MSVAPIWLPVAAAAASTAPARRFMNAAATAYEHAAAAPAAIAQAIAGEARIGPRLTSIATPATPHPSPSATRAVTRSRSQTADISAPKSGDVALSTTRYDAGRWIALKAQSANGAADVTRPKAG